MTDIDVSLPLAYVTGRFVAAVADGPNDDDRVPDLQPMTGTVTFVPSVDRARFAEADPPVTVFPKDIECALDDDGYLIGSDGERNVQLVATGDLIPAYRVTFTLDGIQRFSIFISAPADLVTDLTEALELPGNPTAELAAWEAAATQAIEAADRAEAAAAIAQSGVQGPKGDPGAPGRDSVIPGPKGDPGIDGTNGESAYELAVDAGFVGDRATWLASLKGDRGIQGFPGADGAPGADSTVPGPAGPPGESAYQLAVDAGFVGDHDAWLASLKGDPGPKGDTGEVDTAILDALQAAVTPLSVGLTLSATDDLDDFGSSGQWRQATAGNATLALHYPLAGTAGSLSVASEDGYPVQVFYTRVTSGTNRVFERSYNAANATWSTWTELTRQGKNAIAFVVALSVKTQSGTSAYSKIGYDIVELNKGGAWDATNQRFIAPATGLYEFTLSMTQGTPTVGGPIAILAKNGLAYPSGVAVSNTSAVASDAIAIAYSSYVTATGTTFIEMSAGDYVEAYLYNGNGTSLNINRYGNRFSGRLLEVY